MVAMTTRAAEEDLGALLRHYRGRRQLTQEQLAERAGLSVGAISRLERGAASLSGRAGRAGDRAVSGCAPAAAPGDHARPVAWTLIRAPRKMKEGLWP